MVQDCRTNGTTAEGVLLGNPTEDLASLGQYGVTKIHQVQMRSFNQFDAQVYTKVIAQVAEKTGAKVIVFSNNTSGKAIAPRLSVRLKAGLVAGAVALPEYSKWLCGKKKCILRKSICKCCRYTPM